MDAWNVIDAVFMLVATAGSIALAVSAVELVAVVRVPIVHACWDGWVAGKDIAGSFASQQRR
mgnify:FL=1